MLRVLGDEALDGDHERGDGGFHVRGPAPVEKSFAHGRRERVGVPGVERTGGHHVGVSREADHGFPVAAPRPRDC